MIEWLMAALRLLAYGLLAVAFVPSASAAAPLEAYARLPSIETISVSPSGHALALVVTNGERRMIVVKRLSDGAFTLRAAGGDAKVRQVIWAGDSTWSSSPRPRPRRCTCSTPGASG